MEGDWLNHMRGMRDILGWMRSLVPEALEEAIRVKVDGSAADDGSSLMAVAPNPDMAMNYLATKWFVQSYAWNDIISAVWIGPRYAQSRHEDFYSSFLEKGYLQMDKFMGCTDWVLFAFTRISKLEESRDTPSPPSSPSRQATL